VFGFKNGELRLEGFDVKVHAVAHLLA
jgi:hypothetical protein